MKKVPLPVVPFTSTTAPTFHDGWGVIGPPLVLLILPILGRESAGKQLLILGKVFRRLSHTTKHTESTINAMGGGKVFGFRSLNTLT